MPIMRIASVPELGKLVAFLIDKPVDASWTAVNGKVEFSILWGWGTLTELKVGN